MLNFETIINNNNTSHNVFRDIVLKIPKKWILKGKLLFEVIGMVH